MADALDLGSSALWCMGSTPFIRTSKRKWLSGRASPCQGEGREFESRLSLQSEIYFIKKMIINNHLFMFTAKAGMGLYLCFAPKLSQWLILMNQFFIKKIIKNYFLLPSNLVIRTKVKIYFLCLLPRRGWVYICVLLRICYNELILTNQFFI